MDSCRQTETVPNCLRCLKSINKEQELQLENTTLKQRIQKLETRLLAHESTTKLLMSTFEILQKREHEINELKNRILSLESNETLIALKSKLQYVQSLNLRLQEDLSSTSSLQFQLELSKQEINRLTQIISISRKNTSIPLSLHDDMPMKGVRRSNSNQNPLRPPELSSMPSLHANSIPVFNSTDPDNILFLSDSDLTLFTEEMAGALGTF